MTFGASRARHLIDAMNDLATPVSRPLEPRSKAIVVGASSGVGAALVRRLAVQGYDIAAIARREPELLALRDAVEETLPRARVLPYVHDVTDFDEVPGLFDQIVRDLGGLDLVVYAAGVQPAVGLSEYDFSKDQTTIETNLLGAIAWLNPTAERFERARAGRIVGLGSIAGDRGRVASPVYNTSKAALDTYLEALRNRLSRHGVKVTTVKLGFVDTRLLENAARTFWVISPDEAAAGIYAASQQHKQVVYIPGRWRLVSTIIQAVPSTIFRRLSF